MGDPRQEKVRKYPFMSDERETKANLIKCFPKEKDAINKFFQTLRVCASYIHFFIQVVN